MKKQTLGIALISLFIACNPSDNEKRNMGKSYFDLQSYFAKEAERLNKEKPTINKEVSINGEAESKLLKIEDWSKELASFTNADINKTAWMGAFEVKKLPGIEIYTTLNEKVPVKELRILRSDKVIKGIQIQIKNTNLLYNSVDTLSYFPDSLYSIKKTQHLKLLPQKKYQVTGNFKRL
ncbi:hypothetical protein LPB86_12555 [Pedobacter sp. MC2016-14]|uniref:hypothetical protein n=1 Tax=Pedobacter sp. MC2016-14 TaxID=2897327 RepID=UPI001E4628DE|nr:hypothetical protein [Pedobacter sp. MC2016-14]MCD0489063.1 hypothetical protein [Pedobacter sp. MC2016-14]